MDIHYKLLNVTNTLHARIKKDAKAQGLTMVKYIENVYNNKLKVNQHLFDDMASIPLDKIRINAADKKMSVKKYLKKCMAAYA